MKLPDHILAKYLARFDTLGAEGRNILSSTPITDSPPDLEMLVEWRTKATTLLDNVIPAGHIHRKQVDYILNLQCDRGQLQSAVSTLRAIKDDLSKGFLDPIARIVEAEIAADYMGQAERLMDEDCEGKFDHCPAAVLAGAVLEKALRTLCLAQEPPITTNLSGGLAKGLSQMTDDLQKAGVFTSATTAQLKSWAKIRNLAAHGEFEQFNRQDTANMLSGINAFLSQHLG